MMLACLPDYIQDCLPNLLSALVGGLISGVTSWAVMKNNFKHQEKMEDKRRNQEDARREADFRLDSLLHLQEAILASSRLTTKCAFQLKKQLECGVPPLNRMVDAADDEKLSYELRMVMIMSSRVQNAPLSQACNEFRNACWGVLLPKEPSASSGSILSELSKMSVKMDSLLEILMENVEVLTRGTRLD